MIKMIKKWWPLKPDIDVWQARLHAFYTENSSYHDMTAGGKGKASHPQVKLLLSIIKSGELYAEIGCGSGEVCAAVAEVAGVTGYDLSPIAIDRAIARYHGSAARFAVAAAGHIPVENSSLDGVYSFEMLEHLWNPVEALREMARLVKPGGFILVSCPNHFSLDLHLQKRKLVRMLEAGCAATRFIQLKLARTECVNLVPDVDKSDFYPDCDMVSSLISWNVPELLNQLDLSLEFIDTFYMCAVNPGAKTDLAFQKNCRKPFVKWFGDHILFLARKTVRL